MLIRGGGENPKMKQLDLEAFLKKGAGAENISLQPGDILYIPRTFVSDMDRFFSHVITALYPVLVLEQGIALYPSVQDTLTGKTERSRTTNIIVTAPPPR
jgi:ribosomal protein L16 Arg81 hydroxylase